MANVNGVAQVEVLDDRGDVGSIVVHVVTVADLARTAMAAPVMGDDAIALLHEVEQLRIPVVAAQGTAVMQDDSLTRDTGLLKYLNSILCGDRAHLLLSFAWVRRKKGWLSGHLGCESIRPSSRDGGDHTTSVCDGGGAPV